MPVPSAEVRASARTISLAAGDAASVETIVRALPAPSELEPGALVFVAAEVAAPRSIARSVLSALGRAKTVSRAMRCSALLARGYTDVASANDEKGTDLVWAHAPTRSASPDGA